MKTNFFLLFVLISTSCVADGLFIFDQKIPALLSQKPVLARYLNTTLEFAKEGVATRVGTEINPTLGGVRIGPYRLNARPKGKIGPYTLYVVFNTEVEFKDKTGKITDSVNDGIEISERLISVEIRESEANHSK